MSRGRVRRLLDALGTYRLTRRGLGFLLVGLLLPPLGARLDVGPFVHVGLLLVALVVCAGVHVASGHARVAVARSFRPDVADPGEPVLANLTLRSTAILPSVHVHWSDRVGSSLVASAQGVVDALGGSTRQVQLRYVLRGTRRGRHPVGPLSLQAGDPFGLVTRHRTTTHVDHVVVLPRRVPLGDADRRGSAEGGATLPASQHVGVGEDDVIARPYVPGDEVRRLHWKATAHRGQLMVRQEEQRVDPAVLVVLDASAEAHDARRDRQGAWEHAPTLEWAVSACASLVEHLVGRGYVVHLEVPGSSTLRVVGEGQDTVRDVLVDLALLDPTPAGEPLVGPSGDAPVVAVLGRVDERSATAWARLAGRRSVALVAHGSSAAAVGVLEDRGWRCVRYRSSDDLRTLWHEDVEAAGAAR
jgi:uncharacterized protein (DUF58 family)